MPYRLMADYMPPEGGSHTISMRLIWVDFGGFLRESPKLFMIFLTSDDRKRAIESFHKNSSHKLMGKREL